MIRLLLCLVFLVSCQSVNIPLQDDFNYIHRKKYELNVYDCSNKSSEYLTRLQKAGFNDSKIWTYKTPMFKGYSIYVYHAVVEVNGVMLDPTTGGVIKGFKADLIRKQSTAKTVSYKELQELIKENPQEWKF